MSFYVFSFYRVLITLGAPLCSEVVSRVADARGPSGRAGRPSAERARRVARSLYIYYAPLLHSYVGHSTVRLTRHRLWVWAVCVSAWYERERLYKS